MRNQLICCVCDKSVPLDNGVGNSIGWISIKKSNGWRNYCPNCKNVFQRIRHKIFNRKINCA